MSTKPSQHWRLKLATVSQTEIQPLSVTNICHFHPPKYDLGLQVLQALGDPKLTYGLIRPD